MSREPLPSPVRPWAFRPPVLAAIAVGAVALLLLRRPDAFLRPQFWAEDFLFLIDAETQGAGALFVPRAGYLHALPRLAGLVATGLDPVLQPAIFLLAWLAAAFVVVGSCLSSRLDLPAPARLGCIAAFVLVPHSGEVFFNPTNAQWVAALALLLTALKAEPARRRDWLVDGGVILVAGFSGPFALAALPVFAWQAACRRRRASFLRLALVAVPAAVQAAIALRGPADTEFSGPFSATGLVASLVYRIPGVVLLGPEGVRGITREAAWVVAFVCAGLLGLVIQRTRAQRSTLVAILLFGAVVIAMTALRKRPDLWAYGDVANGDRYFFIPKVLLLWFVVIAGAAAHRRWLRRSAGALLVVALVLNAGQFRFRPYRDYGWYELAPRIRRGETVVVTVNPDWEFNYRRGAKDAGGPPP